MPKKPEWKLGKRNVVRFYVNGHSINAENAEINSKIYRLNSVSVDQKGFYGII